jgi:hypothetical protein
VGVELPQYYPYLIELTLTLLVKVLGVQLSYLAPSVKLTHNPVLVPVNLLLDLLWVSDLAMELIDYFVDWPLIILLIMEIEKTLKSNYYQHHHCRQKTTIFICHWIKFSQP